MKDDQFVFDKFALLEIEKVSITPLPCNPGKSTVLCEEAAEWSTGPCSCLPRAALQGFL